MGQDVTTRVTLATETAHANQAGSLLSVMVRRRRHAVENNQHVLILQQEKTALASV